MKPKNEVEFVLMHAQTNYARKAITEAIAEPDSNRYKTNMRRSTVMADAVVLMRKARAMEVMLHRVGALLDRMTSATPEEYEKVFRSMRVMGYMQKEDKP